MREQADDLLRLPKQSVAIATALLIALGVVLQLRNWLANSPFWNDELAVAINLEQRSLGELTHPLDLQQAAPVGFLMVEKCLLNAFGRSERILRLPALLSAIGAIFLANFYFRRWMTDGMRLMALAMLVVQPRLPEYAAELKPYTCDLLAGLIVLCAEWNLRRSRFVGGAMGLFIVSGIVLPWFSFPVVFVLGAASIAGIVVLIRQGKRERAAIFAAGCGLWVLSSGVQAWLLRGNFHSSYLNSFWGERFMPRHSIFAAAGWLGFEWVQLFRDTFKGTSEWVAGPIAAIGVIVLLLGKQIPGRIFAGILLFAVFAAAIHRYPLGDRLALYLLPMLSAWLAAAVMLVTKIRWRGANVIAAICFVFLIADAVGRSAGMLVHPVAREDSKTVLRQIAAQARPDDTIYIFFYSDLSYRYYAADFGLHQPIVFGSARKPQDDPNLRDLLSRKRAWLYFAHGWQTLDGDPPKEFTVYANTIAKPVTTITASGAGAFLYEPSK